MNETEKLKIEVVLSNGTETRRTVLLGEAFFDSEKLGERIQDLFIDLIK